MKEKSIICFLCGNEATEQSEYKEGKITHNTIMQCSVNCKPYETTTESRKFYLEREDGKELPTKAKQILIKYLEKNYKNNPIRLTTEIIKNLTGGECS